MRAGRWHLLLIATMGLLLLPASDSQAAGPYVSLQCNTATGTPVPGTNLFLADPMASGSAKGACLYADGTSTDPKEIAKHIFSWIMCKFVMILNSVLGKIYCGMQYTLVGFIGIVFTLYIAVFGVQILAGMTQLNVKEIMIRLLKISVVWVFVSEASWGIGYAFDFFLGFVLSMVYVIVQVIPAGVTVPTDQYQTFQNLYLAIDTLVYNSVFGLTSANAKVIGLFAVMAKIYPPIFFAALYWVWMNLTILYETLKSFLLGLAAIAFLVSLSPIFLSFMLFQVTYHFFENWLKFMISYSLQIVIVCTVTVMWAVVTSYFIGFANELTDIVFDYKKIEVQGDTFSGTLDQRGICPLAPLAWTPTGPSLTCQNPAFDPIANAADKDAIIPASKIPEQEELLTYLFYHLLTIIIVAYGFSALIEQAPKIAKSLSGPEYTPILGQGWSYSRYGQMKGAPAQSSANIVTDKSRNLAQNSTGFGSSGRATQGFLEQTQNYLLKPRK